MNRTCLQTGSGVCLRGAIPCSICTRWVAWLSIVAACGYSLSTRAVVLQEVFAFGDIGRAELTLGADGNFYGLTQWGGSTGHGTVFRVTPEGVLTTLVSFSGTNGDSPGGSLTRARDGNFYGITRFGGTSGLGTAFRLTPDGTITTLVHFSGPEGAHPIGPLCEGQDGHLYGTTSDGGARNFGTMFRLTTGGVLTPLYSFPSQCLPSALVQTGDGVLYGVTVVGGGSGRGSVFKVTTNGVFNTIFSFNGDNGDQPSASLLLARDGYLYGVTIFGGNYDSSAPQGHGTVFKIAPRGTLGTLVRFSQSNGENPCGRLVQTDDGSLYGTTLFGGAWGQGTIFQVTSNGFFKSVLSFDHNNGAVLWGGLTRGTDGSLYGMTSTGGQAGEGTIFRMTPSGSLTTLAEFQPIGLVGGQPLGALLAANDNNLYGTTAFDGAYGRGTVFKMTPKGTVTTLAHFNWTNGATPQNCKLIQSNDGFLYGTTWTGGSAGKGTVFRIGTNGGLTSIASFQGPNGATPLSGLMQAADGNFYGTTYAGGSSDGGTIFKLNTNGVLRTICIFYGQNGRGPNAPLMQASDGCLYGTTDVGGPWDRGTIFRVTTNGSLKILVNLTGSNGSYPEGGPLVECADGYLYGTTSAGGAADKGTVFRVTTNGTLTTLATFNGTNGAMPYGLTSLSEGYLYGTTLSGGAYNCGTIYRLTTNGVLTTLVEFDSRSGRRPFGELAILPNGSLYGVTANDGTKGWGNVFRLDLHSITDFQISGSNAILNCSGVPNCLYDIQSTTDLSLPVWDTAGTCLADAKGRIQFQHAGAVNAPARFYRLAPR